MELSGASVKDSLSNVLFFCFVFVFANIIRVVIYNKVKCFVL